MRVPLLRLPNTSPDHNLPLRVRTSINPGNKAVLSGTKEAPDLLFSRAQVWTYKPHDIPDLATADFALYCQTRMKKSSIAGPKPGHPMFPLRSQLATVKTAQASGMYANCR